MPFSDGDFTFSGLIISETSQDHQFSVSCGSNSSSTQSPSDPITFGPIVSEKFIIHEYCEQVQMKDVPYVPLYYIPFELPR